MQYNPHWGKSRKHAKSNPQKDPAKTENKRKEVNTATIKDTQNTCIYRGANKTNHTQLETMRSIEQRLMGNEVQYKTNNTPEECTLVAVKAYQLLAVTEISGRECII